MTSNACDLWQKLYIQIQYMHVLYVHTNSLVSSNIHSLSTYWESFPSNTATKWACTAGGIKTGRQVADNKLLIYGLWLTRNCQCWQSGIQDQTFLTGYVHRIHTRKKPKHCYQTREKQTNKNKQKMMTLMTFHHTYTVLTPIFLVSWIPPSVILKLRTSTQDKLKLCTHWALSAVPHPLAVIHDLLFLPISTIESRVS